jgi:hypothetical protein
MAHGWESKWLTCIEHKKTFSFVKLLQWLNIFVTFCKKKNFCLELNILRSKTVSQVATLFLLLFGQHWRKHDCFWKCSSKKTSRCTLLATIEVSTEKKNYLILFVWARYYELQNTLKQQKMVKHVTFKSQKACSWATMRRNESVEQNKNGQKNSIINPIDDTEASGGDQG